MRIKAFYGALLSVVLAFATLVGIASPANAATTDVASSSWNLKSNSAATSVSDFTAGKVWRFSGTGVEEGSSIRYNTAVTGANGTAVDAVQITHTNCYGNGATVTAVSASGGSVTYTTNRPHNLSVGMYVTISGMTPAGYNVTAQKITAVPSDKTFTLVNATTAAATVYGTLANAYPGITGISKSGTTYTITTNVAHKLVAQTSATLKGLTGGDASYTTAFTAAQSIVSVIDSTNFTVTNATVTTGTAPTGGYLALDACPTLSSWDGTATDNIFDSQTKTSNTAGYKNNGITFSWEFYEHGTYTGPGTGTPITLQNLWMSVADIDDSAANNGTPQFAEFSGFQNFSLSKATAAATSCSLPAAVNITGASISGNNVTFTTDARLTTSGGLFVATNTPVTIRGVTPSSLNGAELTVASATTTAPYTITINNMSNPGAYVSGGSVIWNPSAVATNAVSNPRCDNSNLNVNNVPGTNLVRFANVVDDAGSNDPKDFAATFYQAVSKVDVKLGSVGINGSSIFALAFGAPNTNVAAGAVGWGANGEYKYSNSYNTPPTESNLPTINVSNGVAYTLQTSDFGTYYDFDGNPFTKVKIVSLPTSGKMQVKIAGTWTDLAINGTTNVINVSDVVAGNLRFTGSANATFTYQVNDSLDYSTTYTGTIAVASLTQTITFTNPGTKLTTDAAITNAASASSGLTVTLTSATTGVCTVSGTTITLTGTVGTCTVTASQAGGSGYASAQNVTQSFSVNDNSKTGQVITFAKPADQVYSSGKTVSVPATTSASGLQVTLVSNDTSVCTVSGASSPFTVTLVAKGTCSLTASQAGDATRFAAASASQTFNVTGAQYTLTFDGNGSEGGSVPSAVTSADTWQAAAAGTMTKSGSTFSGWTDNNDGTGTSYATGDFLTLSGAKTIFAKWTAASYTITYADGGSTGGSLPSNTTGSGSVSLALNTGSLVKTGYYFNGWTIAATNYGAGGSYTLSGNVTATARWSQYTVTYDANGATSGSIPSATLGYGSTALASNSGTLAKTGYYFDGWTIAASNYGAGTNYTISGNVTAYANWSQYTVTYAGNGNTSGSAPSATGGNGTVTLASNTGSLVKTGYYFDGWTIGASSYSAGGAFTLSGNVAANAKWSQYTITYLGNGNDGGSAPAATNGYLNTSLAYNTGSLTKIGFDFAGWTISSTDYAEGDTYSLTGNVTATAKWTVNAYHITYTDSQATSGSVPSATGGNGNVPIAGKATLAYSNHYFIGWNINGLIYGPGDTYNLTGDVTATATWGQYTLTFGGALQGNPPADITGFGQISLPGNVGNLDAGSFYFDGWDINGVQYAAGATFDLQADSNATPHWSQYTITYDTNGANETLSPTVGYSNACLEDGLTLTKNDLLVGNTTTSYVFGGWTIGATNYNGGDNYPLLSNVTATAIWNAVVVSVYTVTYDGNGADSGSVSSDSGQSVTVSDQGTLVKSGYTFGGWAWAGNTYHQGETYSFPTNADVTFTAIWDPIVYTLTFADGGATGGSTPADEVSTAGSSVDFPDQGTLVNPGYSFGGWDIYGVTHAAGEKGYVPTGNETATAIWTPIVFHFVYDGSGSDGGAVPTGFDGYGDVTIVGNTGSLTNGIKVFGGWVINGVTHLPGARVSLTSGDVTAYALWVDNVYQLSYQDDGSATSGSAPAAVTGYGSVELAPSGGSLTWDGHHIDGWTIDGKLYALGSNVDLTSTDLVATAHWAIDQISITYTNLGADTGVGPGIQTGDYYTSAILFMPGDLVKNGYIQTGWLIEGSIWDLYDNGFLLVHDVVADPVWSPIVHTVTFDCTVSTSGTCPSSLDSTAGSEIVLPDAGDLENYGYTFGGWLINGAEHSAGEHYVPSGDETATPIWNAIVYHVHYVGNGNTGGSAPADDDSVAFGGVSLSGKGSLARPGYAFGGWTIDGVTYAAGARYIPQSGDVTARAIWNAIVYTVTYAGNGNTGGSLPANGVSTAGSAVVLAGKGTLVRAGYTFGGWSIAGTTYDAGVAFVPGSNVTATAVWSAIVYTVTYAGNGNTGGSLPANGVSTAGSAVTLAGPGNLSKSGFTFGGWSIGGTTYQPNTSFIPGANVTATAVWVNAGVKAITYSNIGATSGTAPAATTGVGNVILAGNTGNLAKVGFTFGGWKINGTVYAAGGSYNLTANATAAPVWNPIVYALTFDGNGNDGGSVPAVISGYGRVTLSANTGSLTRYGYAFAGWNISGATFAAGSGFNLTSGNVTAKAIWNPLVYNASFTANGANGTLPSAILGFGSVTLPSAGNLAKLGFTFGGWSYGGTTYPAGSTFSLTSGNVILQAVWTPIVYNLTFALNGGSGTTPGAISGFGTKVLPTAIAFNRVGFTFGGWSDGSSTYEAGGRYSLTNGDQLLSATWTPIVYNLTYSAKDADSGNAPAADSGFGTKTIAGAGSLSRYGYVFIGWRIAGATYAPGASFDLTNGDANAAPIWQKLVYSLTYSAPEANSGAVAAISGYGTVKLSDGGNLVRAGFKLTGWSINNAVYPLGSSYSLNGGNVNAAAIWAPIVFVITYGNNNATGGTAPAASSGYGTITLPVSNLTRSGYQLTGWRIDGQTYALGASYELTSGSFTATPVWTAIVYTLNFDSNGATGAVPTSVSGFGTVTLPSAGKLAIAGFVFGGWQVGNTTYSAGDTFTLTSGNVTAYAQWNALVFTVSFTVPGATSGDAPAPIQGWGDIQLPKASGFKRLGYDFAGWKVGDGVLQPGQTISVRRADVTARATWQTQIVYKEFSGFAPGSPLLTSDMKSQISTWIKANPGFTVADCVGYTMGPTVLAVDKALATNRAQYACGYVNNTFPKLDATGKWGGNDLVVGDPIRRVRITLHN